MRSRHPPVLVFALVAALVTIPASSTAAAAQDDSRVRIAVVDFRNNSDWTFWGPRLGAAAADELATQLVRADEFSVIERDRLRAILDEQGLGQSGAVDPSTAASIGELLGVQAIVTGSITKFSIDRKSGGIGPLSASYSEAESALDVRLVDTSTGEILMATEGSGEKRFGGAAYEDVNFRQSFDRGLAQEALRPAVEKTVEGIVDSKSRLESLEPVAPSAKIVGSSGGGVYIDRGENFGVEVGQRYDVYRVVDEIRDADGNLLDEVTEKVGVIEVKKVLSKSSICRIVEGEAAEGDEVEPRR